MRSIFAALAAALLASATVSSDALAQEGSEDCLRLEAQLASLGRPKGQDPRQMAQAAAKQQSELERTTAYAKQLGCGPRLFFMPDPPAECRPLSDRIRQMQANLDRLQAQASQAAQNPSSGDPRRRDLLIALARGQCGPQYRLVERKIVTQPERKGFFSFLFGGGQSEQQHEETVIEPEMDPQSTPRVSTYRTVCVRTCDGFFFPISYQTSRNAFERDEAICQATCPGAEAKLFAYPNPGGQMEQAASVDGEPYTKLENAFRYRKEFVSGCSCKPEGMSWAQALSGVEDKTVKKGDIVVDEQKAHEMSRPKDEAETQAQMRLSKPPAPRTPAPAPPSPPPADEQQPTGAAQRSGVPDDVIILDQPPLDRGGVQRRPLDGPDVERAPEQ
ncbi:DUF2865 domain-containing protein [Hansschlegelia plantiphila]|uniref:DUF2865 domain-containing protein n=1 Tax=Hansschlegelia plantiphila TaxID=374655 RepID=A0A9W6J386_9HYPH|nr:DUF2865 domain-containing protein [Hansschlegelia plantiphila]GLK69532.1 hypothetical protein GCM10008179_31700 [Hansschlegelia plantiphila]